MTDTEIQKLAKIRTIPEMKVLRDVIFIYAKQYLNNSHVHQSLNEAAEQCSLDLAEVPDAKRLFKAAVRELEQQGVKKC